MATFFLLKAVALVGLIDSASAAPGQGCYSTSSSTCSAAAATCSPATCKASGGVWKSASSATKCSTATSCTTMAPGVVQGDAITALAKGFSNAATGSTTTAKLINMRANYIGDGGATTSLQGIAKNTGSTDLGDTIDDFVMDAFGNVNATGANLFDSTTGVINYPGGQMEAVKKGVMNQLMSYLITQTMDAALTGNDAVKWDKAWGLYGYLGGASASATPYATANKRCKNYDTCETNRPLGNGDHDAEANTAIETAFETMTQANIDIIKANIKGTYIQATLRYLNKLDNDVTASPLLEHRQHQGEGLAFWHVLRPHIVGDSTYSATKIKAVIDDIFHNRPAPGQDGRYCQGLNLLVREKPSVFVLGTINENGVDPCHLNNDVGATAGYAITALAKAFSSAAFSNTCGNNAAGGKRHTYIGNGGATTSLQGLAKGSGANGIVIDAFIMSAFDCTGIFADSAAIGFDAGREEAVKKGVMNQLMLHLVVTYIKAATCGSSVDATAWAKAAVVYGHPNDVSVAATPQATANKRCKNYGTCASFIPTCASAAGTGCTAMHYQAKTNVAVANAFLSATKANVAVIEKAIKVTYIQATLRYLNKMDNDLKPTVTEHREHQGEGLAFFQVAKPYLNSAVSAVIEPMYTTKYTSSSTTVARYCTGLAAAASQAASSEVGVLNEAKATTSCSASYAGSTTMISLGCAPTSATEKTSSGAIASTSALAAAIISVSVLA